VKILSPPTAQALAAQRVRSQAGFSVIEFMVAFTIFSVLMVMLLGSVSPDGEP
jgi:prepilin-type N-terminal cleavage/methylation domain-containing protein